MKKHRFRNLIPHGTNFDFVGVRNRRIFMGISLFMVVASIILIFTKGFNYGIDFQGGAEVQLKINNPEWDIAKLRAVAEAGGIQDARIQSIGDGNLNEYVIRVRANEDVSISSVSEQVKNLLAKELKEGEGFVILKSDNVGAAAGSTLRQQGIQAMFFTLLVILIYIGLRFDTLYAVSSVVALFHDGIVVLGVFVLTQKQFDLTILAAVLSLLGYSINDTIIVFDRLRETLELYPKRSYAENANRAINETLARSIVTSLTTFIVAACIMFFGGPVIHDFAFSLVFGIIIGSYSTIFVASAIMVEATEYFHKRNQKNQGKPKKSKKVYQVRADPSSI